VDDDDEDGTVIIICLEYPIGPTPMNPGQSTYQLFSPKKERKKDHKKQV
jgi:hypothetical protein